jgi:hypothetical protein
VELFLHDWVLANYLFSSVTKTSHPGNEAREERGVKCAIRIPIRYLPATSNRVAGRIVFNYTEGTVARMLTVNLLGIAADSRSSVCLSVLHNRYCKHDTRLRFSADWRGPW